MCVLWGGPRREGDDRLLVPELRQGADWTVRAVPGSVRLLHVSDLFVRGAVNRMGTVAVTFRVMPEDAEADLEGIKTRARVALGGSIRDVREEPVAFGLNALVIVAVVSDAAGGSDRLEESLAAIPGVGSVETVDVTLV